jgi:hypothetical protein
MHFQHRFHEFIHQLLHPDFRRSSCTDATRRLFAFFMAGIMAFLMCCTIVAANTGFDSGYTVACSVRLCAGHAGGVLLRDDGAAAGAQAGCADGAYALTASDS